MNSIRGFLVAAVLILPLWSGAQDKSVDPDEPKVERDVAVPARDGIKLQADIFRPAAEGNYPVLVARTPYNRNGLHKDAKKFARAGYIVVCQDARGRFGSEGQWESFVRFDTNDGRDGYDTVEWAAKLPGSTGKVGTFGASYNAFLQWRTAALDPPSLVCMAAHSIPARYTDLEGMGSIKPGRRLQWWYGSMTPDMRKRSGAPGTKLNADGKALWKEESEKWLNFVPWLDLPRTFWEEETEAVHAWLKDPSLDPWALHEGIPNVSVPNFNAIGWFDHCNGNLLLDTETFARAKTETARKGSRVIVGPWSHTGRGGQKVGGIEFGSEAAVDLFAEQLRWFDYWLKGKDNGVPKDSPVRIFVMGDNQWRNEPAWPLKRAVSRSLYLSSGGNANTPAGDGRLVETKGTNKAADHYDYDPAKPVPTLYTAAAFTVPADQAPLAERQDILVYQSEPLEKRLEVTGNPIVELFAASSAPDTDFFARLIDVAPDGTNVDVSLGMVRARYRNGLGKEELVKPGEVVRYEIVLNPTSIAFHPGHRIRLDITSSDFPNFDRNHNTAANPNADARFEIARQSIFSGGDHATALRLPVIEEAKPKAQSPPPIPKYPAPAEVVDSMKKATSFMRNRVSFAGGYAWTWSQDLSEVKAEGRPSLTLIGIQPPGTPTVGLAMLQAYQVTEDPLFLQGAREAAQALMWCQLASGGWSSEFDFDPRKARSYHFRRDIDGGDTEPGKRRAWSTLDDNKTQSALLFLTELANTPDLPEDPALTKAVHFAWMGLHLAQAPNGGWPQMFNGPADKSAPVLKANVPANWPKVWPPSDFYPAYYTLNDNNLLEVMKLLLRADQLEKRGDTFVFGIFMAAANRLGDFLLLAQHDEPQPAWSQQYNRNMEPAWARKFEPPAICTIESVGAMRALIEIWLATGEEKYIETLPKAITWLKKRKLPDGKWARFYELGTDRPIYCQADTYEFTYDDSDLPTHYGFKIDSGFGNKLDALKSDLAKGRKKLLADRAGPKTKEEWTSRARYYGPKVRDALKSQKKDGRWLRDDKIDARTFVQHLNAMTGYVDAAKNGGDVFDTMRQEELKREAEAREKAAVEAAKASKSKEES